MNSSVRIHGALGDTVRFVCVSLLVLFTYEFLANAWIGDGAQITFRTVWNFGHGYDDSTILNSIVGCAPSDQ